MNYLFSCLRFLFECNLKNISVPANGQNVIVERECDSDSSKTIFSYKAVVILSSSEKEDENFEKCNNTRGNKKELYRLPVHLALEWKASL